MHGHGGVGAKATGLVGGAGDHTATGSATDEHRAAAERGAGELLHRREERIHVDVENPTLIHIP